MTKKIEQSNADNFNTFLRERARERGINFVNFSLNGQDRDAAADYLFAVESRYALVEFKSHETDLGSEGDKPKRIRLCELLEDAQHARWKKYHDSCHFIAWLNGVTTDLDFNIYRMEVCNQRICKLNQKITALGPERSNRVSGTKFHDEFFGGRRSLSLPDFELYLAWLMTKSSDSEDSTLQLTTVNLQRKVFGSETFNSVREANDWIVAQKNGAPPAPKSTRRLKP